MLLKDINIRVQKVSDNLTHNEKLELFLIRLDEIHPIISGNKLFKLHYFLEEAKQLGATHLKTFGGAYSNHLVATAYACKLLKMPCTGIVRGEMPALLSPTLNSCMEYGMQLIFITREQFGVQKLQYGLETISDNEKNYYIPEGGYHPLGAAGAALMYSFVPPNSTHIVTASGTATTLAGIIKAAQKHQTVVGVPVLKGMDDMDDRIQFLLNNHPFQCSVSIQNNFHYGGYAKHPPNLIASMNAIYTQTAIPTDIVYTGKMLSATLALIEQNYFPIGSKIACLHTGGLQGNCSLPAGTLLFSN
ncbi:MAG: 1-aminocyclopropane-1-carboxylate deaminase/D-cysteine desulfhydrase [Ferruginibacter sp.]